VRDQEPNWLAREAVKVVLGGVVTLVIALVIARVTIFKPDSDRSTVTARSAATQAKPPAQLKTVQDEIRSLDVWQGVPDTFKIGEVENYETRAEVDSADVAAYTPRELWSDATYYEQDPVYIVGRVISDRARKTEFLPSHEDELRGYARDYEAYVAAEYGELDTVRSGDVVFALGYVAATGNAKRLDGKLVRAVYFVTPRFGDSGLASEAPSGSHVAALGRDAARLQK
jgi:hypothetical protein